MDDAMRERVVAALRPRFPEATDEQLREVADRSLLGTRTALELASHDLERAVAQTWPGRTILRLAAVLERALARFGP